MIGLIFVHWASPLSAATITTQSILAQNQEAVRLELINSQANFGITSPSMNAGLQDIFNAAIIRVFSNQNWVLRAKLHGNLRSLQDPQKEIPAAQFLWRLKGEGYRPFRANDWVEIARGNPTGNAGNSLMLDYQIKVTWDDVPGMYSGNILFELVTVP